MFAVYADGATQVRALMDRQSRDRVLNRPHCAALFCLYRSLDERAVHFLNTYAEAIDAETGEAVMMIVLFDDVSVLGESAKHKMKRAPSTMASSGKLPVIRTSSVLGGANVLDLAFTMPAYESGHITRRAYGDLPDFALYRASPEWSLKFSDAIGLRRSALPCIVAFDDEADSPEGDYTVLPIDDPDHTWNILREALDSYATDDQVRAFNRVVEAMDEAQDAETKARVLQVSITEMLQNFPADWKAILDLDSGKRLDQLRSTIRWVAADESGELSELALQFLELLANRERSTRERKFVVAHEALKRLKVSNTDQYTQARKAKVIGMAGSLLDEDFGEIIVSAEPTNTDAIASRLSSSAPMDIDAMHHAISGIHSHLSRRLEELESFIQELYQKMRLNRQLATEMPRVSFRAALLEAMHNDARSRRNKRSTGIVPANLVQTSSGVVNLLSAILDLARKIAGWA